MRRPTTILFRSLSILFVIALAWGLRQHAIGLLPVDFDEDDYLRAGQQYADGIQRGDPGILLRENYRSEHPPLSKIIYGLTLLSAAPFPEIPDLPVTAAPNTSLSKAPLYAARTSSAIFNVFAVGIIAIINPLAGLFLAVHTFTIKYSSQVMLEGVPTLTSLLVVIGYLLYRRSGQKKYAWITLSAVFLGLTAAAKYYYCLAGAAVGLHWLMNRYQYQHNNARQFSSWRWLKPILLWVVISLMVFFLADPYLWPDPINRLWQSISYHGSYTQSAAVKSAGYPFWQPLIWLSMSVPWHPGVFLVQMDIVIFVFTILGLQRSRQKHPVFFLWLLLGISFLIVWPTHWPQYVLMITAPLAIVAADGFQARVIEPLARWTRRSQRASPLAARIHYDQASKVIPWLLPGLVGLILITFIPLLFQFAMSLTDFQNTAIRDGVNGGVIREVWKGLTGQTQAVSVNLFDGGGGGKTVHYAGFHALLSVLFGAGDLYVFEIIWTVLAVVSQTALGVAVALLLHRRGVFFTRFWQGLFILPWAVPEFVAALSFSQIFDARFGYLALAGKTWAQTAPSVTQLTSTWQEKPILALVVLLTAALWYGFPFMLLSALAGLKLIPIEVYDAAALDGVTGWQLFQKITWPLIFPLLAPAILLRAIFSFNQFYLFTVQQTPVITLSAISYYVFNDGKYAVSAAINIVTVLILIGLVSWFNRISGADEGVTYA